MKRSGLEGIITEWLSLRQVSKYANVSERTLRTWIHAPADALPAVQVRGKILVRRVELDEWLSKHRVKRFESIDIDDIVKDVLQGLAGGR